MQLKTLIMMKIFKHYLLGIRTGHAGEFSIQFYSQEGKLDILEK